MKYTENTLRHELRQYVDWYEVGHLISGDQLYDDAKQKSSNDKEFFEYVFDVLNYIDTDEEMKNESNEWSSEFEQAVKNRWVQHRLNGYSKNMEPMEIIE